MRNQRSRGDTDNPFPAPHPAALGPVGGKARTGPVVRCSSHPPLVRGRG